MLLDELIIDLLSYQKKWYLRQVKKIYKNDNEFIEECKHCFEHRKDFFIELLIEELRYIVEHDKVKKQKIKIEEVTELLIKAGILKKRQNKLFF